MNSKTNKVLGIILVILGALFLLKNFNIFDPFHYIFNLGFLMGRFWPLLFLIIPGLLFHVGFFSGRKREPGLLVPGGILLILGATFQINMLFGGWSFTWPAYIFAVAFGLFELYIFGDREKGLLIPIGILGGLSIIFFFAFSLNEIFGFSTSRLITPLVLILIGLIVIFSGKGKKEF